MTKSVTEKTTGMQRVRYVRIDEKPHLCANIEGTIIGLALKADESKGRKQDLYRVQWDNGKWGLIELNDKGLTIL